MRKIFQFTKRSLNLLTVATVALGVTSCIDDQYADKEISSQMQIMGEGITLPLGSTTKVLLSEFLDLDDSNEGLSRDDDGVLLITQDGHIPQTIDKIGGDDGITVEVNVSQMVIKPKDTADSGSDLDVDVDGDSDINIDESMPDELVSINYATLIDSRYMEIYIELSIDNTMGEVEFKSFEVEFPEYLVFAEASADNSNSYMNITTNILTLDSSAGEFVRDPVDVDKRYFRIDDLEIIALDFSADEYDDIVVTREENGESKKYLVIPDKVTYDGTMLIKDASGTVDAEPFSGTIDVTLEPLDIAVIDGEFEVDIDIPTEEASLGDGLGDLNIKNTLLANPTIELEISNSLDIPIDITSFALTPMKDGAILGDKISVADFTVPAKNDSDVATTFYFVINLDGSNTSSATGVKSADLAKLLWWGTPEVIEISMNADLQDVVGEEWHSINVNTDYDILMDYNVNIPLIFDELYMETSTDIDGLSSMFESLGEDISLTSVAFVMDATNTMSIDMIITSVDPLDASGNIISQFKSVVAEEGVEISAEATTSFSLTMDTSGDQDAFNLLDALRLNITVADPKDVSGTAMGAELVDNEDEYLQFFLKASLPEGIILEMEF